MEILKGMVRDEGYPDVECTYAKIDDSTIYYFIQAGDLPNGNVIASTILKEAIGHAPHTSLGLINKNGDVLIPFENKMIKQVKDNLLLVEKNTPTSPSVLEALKNKSDPFNATALVEQASQIKTQMTNAMGMSGDFVFDNQFSEAALYTMDGLNVGNGYYSFISEMNSKYYFSTNVYGSSIVKFDPESLEAENQEENLPQEENVEQQQEIQETPSEQIPTENEQQSAELPQEEVSEQPQEEVPVQEMESESQDIPAEEAQEEPTKPELKLNIEETTEVPNQEEKSEEPIEQETEEQPQAMESEETFEQSQEEVPTQEMVSESQDIPTEEVQEENIVEETVQNTTTTVEDIQNPTILNATNTIRNLLKENRDQRQVIDKQTGELEAIKSSYEILKEDNSSKEQEIIALRQELNSYRSQSINVSRDNTKLKSTLVRQSEIMKKLEEENQQLREQVAGIHALGNAVAEANVLIQPLEDTNTYNEFNPYSTQEDMSGITYSSLSSEDDNYSKTMAA